MEDKKGKVVINLLRVNSAFPMGVRVLLASLKLYQLLTAFSSLREFGIKYVQKSVSCADFSTCTGSASGLFSKKEYAVSAARVQQSGYTKRYQGNSRTGADVYKRSSSAWNWRTNRSGSTQVLSLSHYGSTAPCGYGGGGLYLPNEVFFHTRMQNGYLYPNRIYDIQRNLYSKMFQFLFLSNRHKKILRLRNM